MEAFTKMHAIVGRGKARLMEWRRASAKGLWLAYASGAAAPHISMVAQTSAKHVGRMGWRPEGCRVMCSWPRLSAMLSETRQHHAHDAVCHQSQMPAGAQGIDRAARQPLLRILVMKFPRFRDGWSQTDLDELSQVRGFNPDARAAVRLLCSVE